MKKLAIFLGVLLVLLGIAFYYYADPIDDIISSPTEKSVVTASYSDGTTSVEATFDNDADTVTFNHPSIGITTLPQAISASGARFANEDESTVFWEHQGELTLTSGGAVVFKGAKVPEGQTETSLGSNNWVWVETNLLSGEKTTAPAGEKFVLSFDEPAKRVTSTTDCNSLSGTYVQEGEVLSVGSLASTKMYCEGSIESVYSGQLALVNSFVIEGETLRLNLNRDYGVMVFKRK